MIRRALPADAAAIRALTRAAYAKWVPLIGREPKPMNANYEYAVQHHTIDLIEIDTSLAALIERIPAPDAWLIENLAVHPDFQRRGLARQLLDFAEAASQAAGHREIRLYTNARFTENIDLYKTRGYAITREEILPVGTVIHMAKPL